MYCRLLKIFKISFFYKVPCKIKEFPQKTYNGILIFATMEDYLLVDLD